MDELKLWDEAREVFHEWKSGLGDDFTLLDLELSDRDRVLFCLGFVEAKLKGD